VKPSSTAGPEKRSSDWSSAVYTYGRNGPHSTFDSEITTCSFPVCGSWNHSGAQEFAGVNPAVDVGMVAWRFQVFRSSLDWTTPR
jgi:hypothetical protein